MMCVQLQQCLVALVTSYYGEYGCYAINNKTIKLLNHAKNSHASAPEYKYSGVITTITTQNLIG